MLKVLLRKQLLSIKHALFQSRKKGQAVNKTSLVMLVVLYLFTFFVLAASFYGIGIMLCDILLPLNLDWIYFSMMSIFAIFISALLDVLSSYSSLYAAKDNELLMSLPIKESTILTSRMLGTYFVGLLYNLLIFLPTYVAYWTFKGFSIKSFLSFLVMLFVVGLFILVLTCIFGYLVSLFAGKVKSKLLTTAISMAFFLGIYYVCYFRLNDILNAITTNAILYGQFFETKLQFIYVLGQALAGNISHILLFTGIVILLFIITLIILSKTFRRSITTNKGEKRKNYTNKQVKVTSIRSALIKRELKHFFNSFSYMFNCGISPILLTALSIFIFLKFRTIDEEILMLIEEFGILKYVPIALPLIPLVITSMGTLSAPSMSLEGKNIWIIKSLPVREKEIFDAKILLHVIINIVPVILFIILASITFKIDILLSILAIILSILLIYLQSHLGLMLGIRFVNLDWDNETVAVKQGLAVLFSILTGLGVSVLFFGIALLAYDILPMYLILLISTLITISGILLSRKWLDTKGKKMFNEL